MNFMDDTDFLLFMSHCEDRALGFETYTVLTVEERARLQKVGLRTAHEQPAWCRIEPSSGNYDFDYLDRIVNRNREAGLKSLIQLSGWRLPPWIPNEWRARQQNGTYEVEVLSLWNEEAQEYSDRYYQLVADRYSNDPDVGFFYGEFQGGEGIYPASWCLYDDPALDDFKRVYGTSRVPAPDDPDTLEWYGDKVVEHVQRKQSILRPRWNDVWNCQQYLMDRWSHAFGNFAQPAIMLKHRMEWPDTNIVLCQCTYFDSSHTKAEHDAVDRLVKISHCEVIVEAMFPRGLPYTTPLAIAKGFRGQIVMPACEPGHRLEEWEVNNIRDSYNLWLKNYEDHRDLSDVQ